MRNESNMVRFKGKDAKMVVPVLKVNFYQSLSGAEPVRKWLKELPAHERQAIGEDIKAVQFRWPLGMPLVPKLTGKVWEVRHPAAHAHFTCVVHGKERQDGVAACVHQKNTSDDTAGYCTRPKPD